MLAVTQLTQLGPSVLRGEPPWGWAPQFGYPTTYFLDNFNRADGSVGSNWTADPSGQAYVIPQIVSNQAKATASPGLFAAAWWNPQQFGPNVEAYCTVATAGVMRLLWRMTGVGVNATTNGYSLGIGQASPAMSVSEYTNGTLNFISNIFVTIKSGDKVGISHIGNTLNVYLNTGGGWVIVHTATRSEHPGPGYIGIWWQNDAVGIMDDFSGGTVAGSGSGLTTRRTTGLGA